MVVVVFFFCGLILCIFFQRSAKLIPEDDQIFTEVELNMLEKVINETTVGGEVFPAVVVVHSVFFKGVIRKFVSL